MSELTKGTLAPIIVALLSIVSVSLFGFVVALWPDERAPAPRPQDASHFVSEPARQGQGTWM